MAVKPRALVAILALLAAVLLYVGSALLSAPRAPAVALPAPRTPPPAAAPESAPGPASDASDQQLAVAAMTGSAPRDRLEGRVVDAAGNGLAGIRLRLRTLRHTEGDFILRQAVTDAGGGFALSEIDPRGVYLLYTVAAADYPAFRREGFTPAQLPSPFEIRLPRLELVDIEGTVVDAEHAPVANFALTFDSLDSEYPARTVASDASGQFRVPAFPAGGLKVYTANPEYFRILGLAARPDEYRSLTLVIDRGRYRLAGRVVDERGAPVAPARITLSSQITGAEYWSHALRSSLTDASGSFEFSGLGGIPHNLGVYASGFRPYAREHEFQSFSDRVEIRLRR